MICNLGQTKQGSTEVPFFVKIFSDQEITLEPLEAPLEYLIEDTWENIDQGGFIYQSERSEAINPFWCNNP